MMYSRVNGFHPRPPLPPPILAQYRDGPHVQHRHTLFMYGNAEMHARAGYDIHALINYDPVHLYIIIMVLW